MGDQREPCMRDGYADLASFTAYGRYNTHFQYYTPTIYY